jgi:F-type H+-transporting ATPase subunit alpha
MAAEKQIAVIFAATNGFVDEYDLRVLMEYEKQYLSYLENSHPDILSEIREKKIISAELDSKMKKVLDEFKAVFNPPSVSIV